MHFRIPSNPLQRKLLLIIFMCIPIIGLTSTRFGRNFLLNNKVTMHIKEERQNALSRAKSTALNHALPSFHSLADYVTNGKSIPLAERRDYVNYYEKVTEQFPQIADAHAMLGFSYYHAGEADKAITSYNKAIEMNPVFLWSRYNLGLIYFKERQYLEAVKVLGKAIEVNPGVTLSIIYSSKIYRQIIAGFPSFDYSLQSSLMDGYRDCYELLVLGFYQLKSFPDMYDAAFSARRLNLNEDGIFDFYAAFAQYKMGKIDEGFNGKEALAQILQRINLKTADPRLKVF